MIKTRETAEQRTARHRKEYISELGNLPEEAARIQANFYFRPHGLYECDLAAGRWDESDRRFSGIAEPFWKERLG
jgi:hypothetical protein